MALKYKRLRLDLQFTWAIARNSSDFKENFIIELSEGAYKGWGESAPNIRYGETPDGHENFLREWASQDRQTDDWPLLAAQPEVPASLRFAVEAAWEMLQARKSGLSLAVRLGLLELQRTYPVSFTLPIMPAAEVEPFFHRMGLGRFPYLKVKVGKQSHDEALAELGRLYTGPVLIDGNEAFTSVEELDRHVAYWQKHVLLAALEQPFPAHRHDLALQTKGRYPFPTLADESLTNGADLSHLAEAFEGINIKLQKAGTYTEALRWRHEAHALSMKVMVGCMVETSVGIWHGLQLAAGADFVDLDSMLYLAQEPFGWVGEEAGHLHPLPDSEIRLVF